MARLVLSGAGVLEPSFLFHLESEVALLLLRDERVCRQVESVCVRSTNIADCRTAAWIGASTIGAMVHELRQSLVIDNVPIAATFSLSEYRQASPEELLQVSGLFLREKQR